MLYQQKANPQTRGSGFPGPNSKPVKTGRLSERFRASFRFGGRLLREITIRLLALTLPLSMVIDIGIGEHADLRQIQDCEDSGNVQHASEVQSADRLLS